MRKFESSPPGRQNDRGARHRRTRASRRCRPAIEEGTNASRSQCEYREVACRTARTLGGGICLQGTSFVGTRYSCARNCICEAGTALRRARQTGRHCGRCGPHTSPPARPRPQGHQAGQYPGEPHDRTGQAHRFRHRFAVAATTSHGLAGRAQDSATRSYSLRALLSRRNLRTV